MSGFTHQLKKYCYFRRVISYPNKYRFRRHLYLLFGCCFFAACHHAGNGDADKNEPNLPELINKQYVIDKSSKALPYLDSLYRAQKNKTPYIEAGRYLALANFYHNTAQDTRAIPYVDSATTIVDQQDLSRLTWRDFYFSAYLLKGNIFFKMGNYPLAIDGYFKAKTLADKTDNACGMNHAINNFIGLALYKQKKYDDARNYFKAAYQLIIACPPNNHKAAGLQQLLDNVALCFSKQEKLDSALIYYHKALRLTETSPEKFSPDPVANNMLKEVGRGVILGNIAQLLVKENKLDSAEMLFKENIFINSVLHKTEVGDAQLSQMYLADLYSLRGRYPKMKQVLTDLRKSLDTLRNEDAELGWRRLMAEYDRKNNLPQDELKHYNSYIQYRDSLDNAKKQVYESNITSELKAHGQQLEIGLLQKENQLSRLYLWITISLSGMALIIVGLIYYYYRRSKKNIRALTLLNREVGEQKEKLEFAVLKLDKSNADKERILRVVAHDLRNPLSGIVKMTDYMINEDKPGEYISKKLSIIEKTSANSLTLINELLELDFTAQHIQTNKKQADLNEIVKQCTSLMQLIADKKNQKIQLRLLPKPLNINIDKERMERMINNLIGNAIKFSPADEEILIGLEEKEQSVLLTVKDNGIGVPPEMQADLFNTFGNTRRKGTAGEKSFGLGLSICKQIIEAHDGKIWLNSTPGKGTMFYVELPLG